jgi:hypothetical protein
MYGRGRNLTARAKVSSCAALRGFVKQHAAFIAQKSAVDYCRAKTGVFHYQLFQERDFIDALARCRWEGFGAALADILIMTEAYMRPYADGASVLIAERLAGFYPELLASEPMPAHRTGWEPDIEAFRARMAAARERPTQPVKDIATHTARVVFNALPIHTRYRNADEGMVFNSIRFAMVSLWERMHREIDGAAVARDLAAEAPAAAPSAIG